MEEVKKDLIQNLQSEGQSDILMATSSQNYEDDSQDPYADAQDPYTDEADISIEDIINNAQKSIMEQIKGSTPETDKLHK